MTADPTVPRRVIALRVGQEVVCLDVLSVCEIVRTRELGVTRVPHAHPYVDGVVNLRGKVVPVIDLRRRVGARPRACAAESAPDRRRLVVVEAEAGRVALRVDAVSQVLELEDDTFGEAGSRHGRAVTVKGMIVTYVEVERLLDADHPVGSVMAGA